VPLLLGRRRPAAHAVTRTTSLQARARQPPCTKVSGVQPISFRKTEYPNISSHFRAALGRKPSGQSPSAVEPVLAPTPRRLSGARMLEPCCWTRAAHSL
jgi:hypothetical protein